MTDYNIDFFLSPQESWGKLHGWYAVAKSGIHDARLLREEILNNKIDLYNIKKAIVAQLYVDQEYNKEFIDFWNTANDTDLEKKISIQEALTDYQHEKFLSLINKNTEDLNSNSKNFELFDLFDDKLDNSIKKKIITKKNR